MEGRFSREAKGKGVAIDPIQPPRNGRVKAQAPTNHERAHKHSLTLIGRVTNLSVQRVLSLTPFLTDLWKTDGRPIWSDLGSELFQFQFESKADLNGVFDRRLFYILPNGLSYREGSTVSASFSSLFPFWIKVQGIPIHLWSEDTIKSLGEDFGIFEQMEITDFSIRMREQINGLLLNHWPLSIRNVTKSQLPSSMRN